MADQFTHETARAEILDLLSRINNAWLHKRGDELTTALNACFAEDVVMRGPGFVLFGKGRDLAVQSYRDFVSQAEVRDFSLEAPEIDIAGETATAHYKRKLTYAINGQEYTEQGREVFVLSRRTTQWLAVWRVMLTEPA